MKNLLLLSFVIFNSTLALADDHGNFPRPGEVSCSDKLEAARDEIFKLRTEVQDLRRQLEETSNNGNHNEAVIKTAHYLESATCHDYKTHVGAGSRIEVLDPHHYSVGHYPDALRVRLIYNTETSPIAATNGCEGFALAGYVIQN
jgi:hypothetical protein